MSDFLGFDNLGFDFPVDSSVDVDAAIYSMTPDNPYGYEAPTTGADGSDTPQPFGDSDPEGDMRDARMSQLFAIDKGISSSGTPQQGEKSTIDKVMATLEKNPKLAAMLVQGAGGLIAGAGAGYAAKQKQEFEDKKIQEAWGRRRLEAKPGTIRKENWGGLIQTAKG